MDDFLSFYFVLVMILFMKKHLKLKKRDKTKFSHLQCMLLFIVFFGTGIFFPEAVSLSALVNMHFLFSLLRLVMSLSLGQADWKG